MNVYKLSLLAMLAAMAIVGRAAMATVPNVQPVTAIIIMAALLLGAGPAVLLTIVVVMVSNMVLGMGIWSLWEIVSWGAIAVLTGLVRQMLRHLPVLIAYAVFCGYLYGFIISFPTYSVAGDFWPYYLAGLPFDTNHAIGNGIFIAMLYPIFSRIAQPYIKHFRHK